MAEIQFYATEVDASTAGSTLIDHGAGSGLGFYGGGYGISVPIGGKQDTTWITNADGTATERIQLHNNKYMTSGTVSVDGAEAINLDAMPNTKCPLNIRFTHDTPVRTQNCKLRIFDRSNIDNHASGVTNYVYEARHPSNDQAKASLSQRGRSEASWYEFDPVEAMTDMVLTSSPGASGLNTDSNDVDPTLGYASQEGVAHESDRHDWYVGISCDPDSIGAKLYGLHVSIEYL